jgi:peptidyl-prolyl isomerase D
VIIKDEDGAEQDCKESLENVPGDAGVIATLKNVQERKRAKLEKEKKAYAKMFA